MEMISGSISDQLEDLFGWEIFSNGTGARRIIVLNMENMPDTVSNFVNCP